MFKRHATYALSARHLNHAARHLNDGRHAHPSPERTPREPWAAGPVDLMSCTARGPRHLRGYVSPSSGLKPHAKGHVVGVTGHHRAQGLPVFPLPAVAEQNLIATLFGHGP